MFCFCRLNLESSGFSITFVWCEVITEGVVGGGDDVVNFRANLKLKFAHSECPLTAPVRLGIALAGFVHLPYRAENTTGQNIDPGRESTIAIISFHRTVVGQMNGWCIDTIQTGIATRYDIGIGRLFKQA